MRGERGGKRSYGRGKVRYGEGIGLVRRGEELGGSE